MAGNGARKAFIIERWLVAYLSSRTTHISSNFRNKVLHMSNFDKSQLLAEIEDLIRTAPPLLTLHQGEQEQFAWLGRASLLVRRWNPNRGVIFDSEVRTLHAGRSYDPAVSIAEIFTTLHEARQDLRLNVVGPLTIAVQHGAVFDYFDEVRKVMGAAQSELFFVDPYMESEFVSRYIVQVPSSIRIRLLGKKSIPSLLPAVELIRKQNRINIEVRSNPNLHDRFLFVDSRNGFHSGASFKDGTKNAPTTFTEITDTFQPVLATYEEFWSNGIVHL